MSGESLGVLMTGAAVKGATSAAVKNFIDNVITPYLRGMKSKKSEASIKKRLSKYVKIIEFKTRYVSTFANTGGVLAFEEMYEPLTLEATSHRFSLQVTGYPTALFQKNRCIAITDDAGMGKSTLAKHIVRKSIIEEKGIPLLIELRRIRSSHSILQCLCEELAESIEGTPEADALIDLFHSGNFIFVLDGFDEVEESLRPKLVTEINDISARFQFCYFILTSRPEYSISLFPEFFQVSIRKLGREQAYSLIRRYDAGRGLDKLLIPRIDEANVGDFLGNPLLVTLLYRAFDHRNSVPPKRTIFFRQVYDALFQDHDLAKGDAYSRSKECGLDSEDFHKLLRSLGFETFRSGRVSYSAEELLAFIKKALARADIKVDCKRVLQDILKAVPLFQRDGLEIKWAHKSFQEYFASQYILTDTANLRDDLIKKMFSSTEAEKYREIFRFFGEFDLGLMRTLCISPLLSSISEIAGVEGKFELASIFCAVDIYYIANVTKKHEFKSAKSLVLERFGIDIAGRRAIMSKGKKTSFLIVAVLKDFGMRFLLISIIDKKMFPTYKREDRAISIQKWPEILGSSDCHVNDTMPNFIDFLKKIGSIKYVEAAAALHSISKDVVDELAESKNRRELSLARSVLDDF
ncbi:NACHT domain-containing protein [Xanthomonas sacchari]